MIVKVKLWETPNFLSLHPSPKWLGPLPNGSLMAFALSPVEKIKKNISCLEIIIIIIITIIITCLAHYRAHDMLPVWHNCALTSEKKNETKKKKEGREYH